jgi:hypothetical protein
LANSYSPTFKDITLDKKEARVDDVVTAFLDIEDLNENVLSVHIYYLGPDGIAQKTQRAFLNRETGKYEAKLVVGNERPGLWTLYQINILDKEYNNYYIKRDMIQPSEATDFTVVNEEYDITPPNVKSVKVDKERVGEGDSITFSIDASDEQSGVLDVSLFYCNGKYGISVNTSLNPETGMYEGTYIIKSQIAMPLGTWKLLSVSVQDKNGNQAEYRSIPYSEEFKVVDWSDITPPTTPVVDNVSDIDTNITGKTDRYTDVIVKIGDIEYKGISDINGNFNIGIPRQMEGTLIKVTSTDLSENMSIAKEVIVSDGTPPGSPVVNAITNLSNIIQGTAERNSKIEVKVGTYLLGSTVTEADGTFNINIGNGSLIHFTGTKLEVIAIDKAGNRSEPTIVVVSNGFPPSFLIVNEVSDKSKQVTGRTDSGAIVHIKIGNVNYTGTADINGLFKIEIPIQKPNTQISVKATNKSGNYTNPIYSYVVDRTAPITPIISPISNLSRELSGKAEPGSIVTINIGNTSYISVTGLNGYFRVVIPQQKEGTYILVSAKDNANNLSNKAQVKVLDKIAPSIPIVNAVTNLSKVISGRAEARSTITLQIGNYRYTLKTDAKGLFKMAISHKKAGTKISVHAKDASGNISRSNILLVLDKIAPTKPKTNRIYKSSNYVIGKAEAYSTIVVRNKKGVIGRGVANKYGTYKVKIKKQTRNTILNVTATDKAKNSSLATLVKVY